MNGRIYDPTLGRFLQADPHIQAPSNSQSYNRYSYVLNNPLSYTDPSGYFFSKLKKFAGLIVGAILIVATNGAASPFVTSFWGATGLGAIVGGVGAAVNGGNILKGALTGAFSAAAFYGVGTAFAGGDFGSGAYFAKVAAHGTVGGVMSVLQGGKFGHGFAAAGVTQAFSKAIDSIGGKINGAAKAAWSDAGNRIRRVIAAAVVGGTASAVSGGKFANGAVTGAFSRAFNDEMHDQAEEKSFSDRFFDGLDSAAPTLQVIGGAGQVAGGVGLCLSTLVGCAPGLIIAAQGVANIAQGAGWTDSNWARNVYSGLFGDTAGTAVFYTVDIGSAAFGGAGSLSKLSHLRKVRNTSVIHHSSNLNNALGVSSVSFAADASLRFQAVAGGALFANDAIAISNSVSNE